MIRQATTITIIVNILLIFLALTVCYSVLFMVGGKKIFEKAQKNGMQAYFPIINLFVLLEITDMSTFLGILFFIPIVNIIILSILLFKLGTVFNCKTGFKFGLIFFAICFYPLLAFSEKQYKLTDEEYFKALDNAKGESINLMTQDELKEENNAIVEEINVDSVFKSDIDLKEKVAPYKAAKIDILGMEKLKNSTKEENIFEPIRELKEIPKVVEGGEDTKEETEKQTNKFTTELDKPEEVEYIDL